MPLGWLDVGAVDTDGGVAEDCAKATGVIELAAKNAIVNMLDFFINHLLY